MSLLSNTKGKFFITAVMSAILVLVTNASIKDLPFIPLPFPFYLVLFIVYFTILSIFIFTFLNIYNRLVLLNKKNNKQNPKKIFLIFALIIVVIISLFLIYFIFSIYINLFGVDISTLGGPPTYN